MEKMLEEEDGNVTEQSANSTDAIADKAREGLDQLAVKAGELGASAQEKAVELAQGEQSQHAAQTILEWIEAAETFYVPWITWALVAAGIALFVSHAGQLVFGKLATLFKGRLQFGEIINDFLVAAFAGLSLPAVLLIPVGGEAFINSPLQVLSAAAVGILVGVYLFNHGVRLELRGADAKKDKSRE